MEIEMNEEKRYVDKQTLMDSFFTMRERVERTSWGNVSLAFISWDPVEIGVDWRRSPSGGVSFSQTQMFSGWLDYALLQIGGFEYNGYHAVEASARPVARPVCGDRRQS